MRQTSLLNKVFGHLTVLSTAGKDVRGKTLYSCQCDCAGQTEIVALGSNLSRGHQTSCGCIHKAPDLTGQIFGSLTVVGPAPKRSGHRVYWVCRCDCGHPKCKKVCEVFNFKLAHGRQVSCGKARGKTNVEYRKEKQREAFQKAKQELYPRIKEFCATKALVLVTTVEEFLKFTNPHRDNLQFRCEKGHTFSLAWFNLKQTEPYCRKCFQYKSQDELAMREFVLSILPENLVEVNKKWVVPEVNEVDIYIVSLKLSIDYDGLYWHTLGEPNRHFKKREALAAVGIISLQITAEEWSKKRPIVESMIRSRLQKSTVRHYARDLVFGTVGRDLAGPFLDANHLMGDYSAAKAVGLFTKSGELVCLLSYRKNGDGIELARVCSKIGTQVVGGLSKLLKRVDAGARIVSFVDLRYGTGDSLKKLGFILESTTLGWKWTDYKNTFNRLRCRANMDERGLSQEEHAKELKWFKIYDAGQAKFVRPAKI